MTISLRYISSNFIINETAAKAMGMEEPLGQRLDLFGHAEYHRS